MRMGTRAPDGGLRLSEVARLEMHKHVLLGSHLHSTSQQAHADRLHHSHGLYSGDPDRLGVLPLGLRVAVAVTATRGLHNLHLPHRSSLALPFLRHILAAIF